MQKEFLAKLYKWHDLNARQLPWKSTDDPYLIWLSEVILQQTRVKQGVDYYLKFKERFPDVYALAAASEDEVLKLWEGLGYYNRARHLHQSAIYIVEKLNGKFPDSYDGIIRLKGVGKYTAAAIASFAYALPYAVVDGNVKRVVSRLFHIDTPVNSTATEKQIESLINGLLDRNNPGKFNQAMMDFGAMVCTPKNPGCENCCFNDICKAYERGTVNRLPVKSFKNPLRKRYFIYLVLTSKGHIWLHKRTGNDIWRNLYEFPLVELECFPDEPIIQPILRQFSIDKAQLKSLSISPVFMQTLSHQKIYARFILAVTDNFFNFISGNGIFNIKLDLLSNFVFPGIIREYLDSEFFTLWK